MGDSPILKKAFSLLEPKSFDEDQRILRGVASTPTADRQEDIVDPLGARFALPIPFLWQHDGKKEAIGSVVMASPTATGIPVEIHIASDDVPGPLKDRLDYAWRSIKKRLVRGLSIGFRPLTAEPIKGTVGMRYKSWEWLELSAVTIPANAEATITLVKSLDAASLAAPGTRSRVSLPSPGATGFRKDTTTMSDLSASQQLAAKHAELQTKSTRLEELIQKDTDEGGLEKLESDELDGLTGEVDSLTARIKKLMTLEAAQAARATQIFQAPPRDPARFGEPRIQVVDHAKDLPKGTLFARYAMAVAAGKGSYSDTIAYAKRWDAQTPEVSAFIKQTFGQKALEGTAGSASPGWGSELVYPQNLASEFVGLIRPLTIIGRVPGFRDVPFNVRVPVQSGGSTVNWVGEAAPKPVTDLAFTTITVPYHKIAGIIVLTEELVRLSSPSAEATVRRDLTEQIAQFMDEQFIRVAVAAGPNNPASITNGVASPAASGTTLAALYADLATALASFDTAGITTDGLVIVTTPAVARTLSFMTNQLGQTPNGFSVMPTGGTLLGYPVIVSGSVDAGTIVIFKPSEVFLADDGRVSLDASNQATIDMAGGSSPDFNLWQKNCIGIRAERWVTWVKRQAGAVAVIDSVAYVPGT